MYHRFMLLHFTALQNNGNMCNKVFVICYSFDFKDISKGKVSQNLFVIIVILLCYPTHFNIIVLKVTACLWAQLNIILWVLKRTRSPFEVS